MSIVDSPHATHKQTRTRTRVTKALLKGGSSASVFLAETALQLGADEQELLAACGELQKTREEATALLLLPPPGTGGVTQPSRSGLPEDLRSRAWAPRVLLSHSN
jgi:hypothetical protein